MNLEFYRNKVGRIRGQTFKEKITTIANRCNKVANDCEAALDEKRDTTEYRKDFGAEHKICYDLIDSIENKNDANFILDILYKEYDNAQSTGKKEALAYLITGIEAVIKLAE